MPPSELEDARVETPFGPVSFRVYRDLAGNLIVPQGTVYTDADGKVLGVTARNQVVPSTGRPGMQPGRWESLTGFENLRIGTSAVSMTGLILRTMSTGNFTVVPSSPTPPRWVPLTLDSGRRGILRLLEGRMRTIPKSAHERLLDDEESA